MLSYTISSVLAVFCVNAVKAVVSSEASHLSLLQAVARLQPGVLHDESITTRKSGADDNRLFVDVTGYALPAAWYAWNHSGFPRSHQGTPTFVDFDANGVLDYFYHNHYQGDPAKDWDMGLSSGKCDFSGKEPYYESIGADHLLLTEPADSKWKKPETSMDTHGTAILDIDRDGVLDIYIASGGGEGLVGGSAKNAVLLWGHMKEGSRVPNFQGGRDAAEYANLENPDSRGRMNYFADVDGDGLLDVFFQNEPRGDNLHVPGYLMMNKGNRKFERDEHITEYMSTMILTDADGDGHANEFVVLRRDCVPKPCTYGGDKTCLKLKTNNPEWYDFCREHPEGSTAVYKYSHKAGHLHLISPELVDDNIMTGIHPMSVQSGDFDGDAVADLAVLMKDSIKFYYSSKRNPGDLPIGEPSESISWNEQECFADTFRVADLDNDGKQEILVVCFHVDGDQPAHKLFTRKLGRWMHYSDKIGKASMGSFVDSEALHAKDWQIESLCKTGTGNSGYKGYLGKICEDFHGEQAGGTHAGHTSQPRTMGLSVDDFNNDGFMDVVVSYDIGRMLMMRNNFKTTTNATENKFLAIKLVGKTCNQYGIGATVLLTASHMGRNSDKTKVQLREVYAASHETDWLGTKDDRIIFGLGPNGVPEKIEVRWPGKHGQIQVLDNKYDLSKKVNSMVNLMVIEQAVE